MRPRFLLRFLLLLGALQSASAAERPFFTTLGTRDGLPNSAVAAIAQDSKGFLWFGTQGGLVRYDGYSFMTYENAPFQENGLTHNQVQTLFMEENVLWIGTYGGLNRLDLRTNSLTAFRHDPRNAAGLRSDLVVSVARDAKGRLLVGTSKGLDRLDEATGTFFHYGPRDGGVPEIMIRDIHLDGTGRLWVATSGAGLFLHRPETDDFRQFSPDADDPAALPSPHIMSISESPEGKLYFGSWGGGISVLEETGEYRFKTLTLEDDRIYFVNAQDGSRVYAGTWGGGLFVYDAAVDRVERLRQADGTGSIPNDVVYSAFLDSNKVFWVGTNGGGLGRTERSDVRYRMYIHDPEKPESLSPGKVSAVLEDRRGRLWVGVYSGGLNRLDRASGTFIHYRHDPKNPRSLPNDIINYLYEDSRGSLWVVTNGGLGLYDEESDSFTVYRHDPGDPDSLADSVVYAVRESPDGRIWIGTYTKGLDLFDPATGKFAHFPPDSENPAFPQDSLVYALEYDHRGALWIGYNNGLDRYENGKFTRYRYDIRNRDGISSNTVRNIFRDSRDRLWLGTVGGGLMRYDHDTDRFHHFTKQEGLPNNTVRSILEADDGSLWIGTATGIGIIDREGIFFRGYSVYNDLKDRDFHTGAWKAADGYMYFGGQNTLYQLNPNEKLLDRPPPRLLISDLTVNGVREGVGKAPPYLESLSLPYNRNNFSITFSTVDFRETGRNLYSYKLEGFDKEWTTPSTVHTATYTNLPGGSYVLRVRASDNDGYWNDEALALPVRVASPPWMTLPAFLFYFLVITAFGYLVASQRGKTALRLKIVELTALKSALEQANVRLDNLSMQDGLTGIANRRRLDELLPRMAADCAREKKPLSLIMLDIDFFKGYNDKYGHLKGDETLKAAAQAMLQATERATDLVARYGGEEFVVALPNTDAEGARTVAERILRAVEALGIPNEASAASPSVTVSAGIASAVPEPGQDCAELIDRADTALYAAKSAGRNRFA